MRIYRARGPPCNPGITAKTTSRRDHAHVRRDGLWSDRARSGLLSLRGKGIDVQSPSDAPRALTLLAGLVAESILSDPRWVNIRLLSRFRRYAFGELWGLGAHEK